MAVPKLTTQVLSVHVSDEERASQHPSAETVGAAVTILQRDGIVLIKNVVDHDALTTLKGLDRKVRRSCPPA